MERPPKLRLYMGYGEEIHVALGVTGQERTTKGAGNGCYFWTGAQGRDSLLDSTACGGDAEQSGWPDITTAVHRVD